MSGNIVTGNISSQDGNSLPSSRTWEIKNTSRLYSGLKTYIQCSGNAGNQTREKE